MRPKRSGLAPAGLVTGGEALSLPRLRQLYQAALGERQGLGLALVAGLGLSPAQVGALRWEDVDLAEPALYLRGDGRLLTPGESLARRLKALKRQRQEVCWAAGGEWDDEAPLCAAGGVAAALARIGCRLALPPLRPVAVRGAHLRLLRELGVDARVIAYRAGLGAVRAGGPGYAELRRLEAEAAEAVDGYLAGGLRDAGPLVHRDGRPIIVRR